MKESEKHIDRDRPSRQTNASARAHTYCEKLSLDVILRRTLPQNK